MSAWAYVDHGTSPDLMTPPENKDVQRVVVSRSHAGDVKKDLELAFGDKLEIIPAGGAGKIRLNTVKNRGHHHCSFSWFIFLTLSKTYLFHI